MVRRSLLACAVASGIAATTAQAVVVPSPTATGSFEPFSPAYAAQNSVDNGAADYASKGGADATYIDYTFSGPTTFDRVIVVTRDSPDASDYIANFSLIPDDGIARAVERPAQRGSSGIHTIGGPVTTTNVRLDVDTIGPGAARNTGAMEVLFLNTPAASAPVENVQVINAATPFSPNYAAANAANGVVGRSGANPQQIEYASASLGPATFVDFDLGAPTAVTGFDYIDRIAGADRVTAYDIIFSDDEIFDDSDTTRFSYTKAGIGGSDVFATPITARYIRLDVTGTGATANAGVNDFIVYQQVVPEPAALGLLAMAGLGLLRRRSR